MDTENPLSGLAYHPQAACQTTSGTFLVSTGSLGYNPYMYMHDCVCVLLYNICTRVYAICYIIHVVSVHVELYFTFQVNESLSTKADELTIVVSYLNTSLYPS